MKFSFGIATLSTVLLLLCHGISVAQETTVTENGPHRRASTSAMFMCPEDDHYRRHHRELGKKDSYGKGKKDDSYYSKGKGKGKGDYYKKGKKDKSKDDDDGKKGKKQKKQPKCLTIGEIAESSEDFTTLVEALKAVDLWEDVNDPEAELTIFAPTNNAFADAPEGTIDLNTLLTVLLYHAVDCKVTSSDLLGAGASTITVPTKNDDNTFDVVIKGHDIFIQGDANDVEDLPQVIAADLYACNGVVHVVDKIILPVLDEEPPVPTDPPIVLVPPTILGLVQENGFDTLVSLLELTELDAAVDDPDASLTVFAPTEDAFGQLAPEFVYYLVNNIDVLSLILKFHVVGKVLTAQDLVAHPPPTVETLAEQDITPEFDGTALFLSGFNNDPANLPMVEKQLVYLDAYASNGIVHVINKVLVPKLPVGGTAALKGLTLFNFALAVSGLKETFNSLTDSFTILAPTDDAFMALGDTLTEVLADVDTLTTILATHVIPGPGLQSPVVSELTEITSTLSGIPLTVTVRDTGLFIAGPGNAGDGAKVIGADMEALPDSIIHIIDTVLLPGA